MCRGRSTEAQILWDLNCVGMRLNHCLHMIVFGHTPKKEGILVLGNGEMKCKTVHCIEKEEINRCTNRCHLFQFLSLFVFHGHKYKFWL